VAVQTAHPGTLYEIVPRTLQPGDYVVTGTIETDGTLGVLADVNIVDYDIQVAGPVPYNFLPTNAGSNLVLSQFTATQFELFVPATAGTSTNTISFNAADNELLDCTNCTQILAWFSNPFAFGGVTRVVYQHDDNPDDIPSVDSLISFVHPSDILVATIVPEPSAVALMALGLLGLLGFGWRRRRRS
jgi:hypothetical protein